MSYNLNVVVDDYTRRVLGVVKETYGLRDIGQALDKFASMFGTEFVEQEVSEDYVKKLLKIEEGHLKKHGLRKMSDRELDALFGK